MYFAGLTAGVFFGFEPAGSNYSFVSGYIVKRSPNYRCEIEKVYFSGTLYNRVLVDVGRCREGFPRPPSQASQKAGACTQYI